MRGDNSSKLKQNSLIFEIASFCKSRPAMTALLDCYNCLCYIIAYKTYKTYDFLCYIIVYRQGETRDHALRGTMAH